METEIYFWCQSGEDGTSISAMSKKEVQKRIDEQIEDCGEPYQFLSEFPDEDGGCWMADPMVVVLIKGQIVVPQPVTTVTEFKIP